MRFARAWKRVGTIFLLIAACALGSGACTSDRALPAVDESDAAAPLDLAVVDQSIASPDQGPLVDLAAPPPPSASCPTGRGFSNPALQYPGGLLMGMVMVDLDGDGLLDIAAANETRANVTVLLRRGSGYAPAATYVAQANGDFLEGLIADDFDGDHKIDLLAVAGVRPPFLFRNRGDGTFAPPPGSFDVGFDLLASGDLDGDHLPDLVERDFKGISVRTNQGDGTFKQTALYASSVKDAAAVGDLDGDGHADLVVTGDDFGGKAVVLLNRGDGTFAPAVSYVISRFAGKTALVDMDGDGALDVITLLRTGVQVVRNLGRGVLGAPIEYPAGPAPTQLGIGDLDGDGRPDVALAYWGRPALSILMNDGKGHLGAALDYPTGDGSASNPAIADVDRDGRNDVVVAAYSNSSVDILLNRGGGALERPVQLLPGRDTNSPVARDLDGDGVTDLVVATERGVSVLTGQRGQSLVPSGELPTPGRVHRIAVADFDRDGRPDIVAITDAETHLFLNQGKNAFRPMAPLPTGAHLDALAVGDFDGDKLLDVAAADRLPDRMVLRFGDGRGALGPMMAVSIDLPFAVNDIASADLDGDGLDDLAVVELGGLSIWIAHQTGFVPQAPLLVGKQLRAVSVGDLDGDGLPDLFVAEDSFPDFPLTVLRNLGGGRFAPPVRYLDWQGWAGPSRVVLGDLDGDGLLDVAYPAGDRVHVRFQRGGRLSDWQSFYDSTASEVAVGDFRGLGRMDIATTQLAPSGVHLLINRCW